MSQQINLYDPNLRRRTDLLTATNLLATSMALFVIVFGLGAWARSDAGRLEDEAASLAPQAKAMQDQVAVLGKQLAELKPDAKLEQELASAKAQVASRADMLAMLQKGLGPGAVSFAEYLRGFARQTPSGLWLTGFAVEGDGTGMEIQGRTVDPALVPEYIKRLNGERAFHGQAFSALQVTPGAPPVGSKVTAATTAPFHEFTLTPVAGGAVAAPASEKPAISSAPQGTLAALLPSDAAHVLTESGKAVKGDQK